jgi:hypothetical protein
MSMCMFIKIMEENIDIIHLFIYLPCSRLLTCEPCARATTDTDSMSGRSLTRRRESQ